MKTTLVETKEFDYESVYTSIDPERTYTVKTPVRQSSKFNLWFFH